MRKTALVAFLIAIISGFMLVNSVRFGAVYASKEVSGILSSSTWTKVNSPYKLTGNVLVNKDADLTVEPGVTVELNGYYIMVNGTLHARGTSTDRITFSGSGSISFAQYSASWDEQTESGSIIENANLDSAQIDMSAVSPKISGNIVMSINVAGSAAVTGNHVLKGINVNSEAGSPLISGNTISGEFKVLYRSGSPVISYNTINNGITVGDEGAGPVTISYNTISGEVRSNGVYTVISHNTINGEVSISGSLSSGGSAIVSDNTINSEGIGVNCAGGLASDTDVVILNNKITAGNIGINLSPSLTTTFYGGRSNATIIGNTISGARTAGIQVGADETQAGHTAHGNIARIEKNTISNNYYGIKVLSSGSSIEGNSIANNYYGIWGAALIRYNTVADNSYGIVGGAQLVYNNIQGNSKYSVHLGSSELGFYQTGDLNATYNWWGTTDAEAIGQTIFDYKNDFSLGRVNFAPFLTSPSPQATPETFVSTLILGPVPSPSPSPNPEPSPPQNSTSTESPDQSSKQGLSQTEFYKIAIAILVVTVGTLIAVIGLILRKRR